MSEHRNGMPNAAVATDLTQIRAVVDHLPQPAWTCRPDGHVDYLNRRWSEYTGVPEEEHHAGGWLAAVHPDDRERTKEVWDAFVAGAEYDVNYRLRRHDGAYRWFKTRGTLVRDDAGVPVRVFGTTTDIDDQKQAERRSTAILESITDAFFALGRDWQFTYVNKQAERLLGRTRHDLVGKSIWVEFAPALGTEFERCYRKAAAEDEAVTFEAFYPPLDTWYEVHAYTDGHPHVRIAAAQHGSSSPRSESATGVRMGLALISGSRRPPRGGDHRLGVRPHRTGSASPASRRTRTARKESPQPVTQRNGLRHLSVAPGHPPPGRDSSHSAGS
ncbi:PAS domain-containing protein [Gemmata sp.]|uniref:PAS domain-containing protein n=1 Tax=Gemmata sp. TaxID=1914242 RepID=UPI003F700791